jgi:hypothetical protein
LLLMQFGVPHGWQEAGRELAALAAVVVSAAAGIWMYELRSGLGVVEAGFVYSAAVGLDCGVGFVAAWLGGWESLAGVTGSLIAVEAIKAVVYELPMVALLVWLVGVMEPARFAARYLVVPLVAVVEGYVLLRGGLTATTFGGILLVGLGVWRLCASKVPDGGCQRGTLS